IAGARWAGGGVACRPGGNMRHEAVFPRINRDPVQMPAISPLAPARFPELPPIAGVRLASYEAGVRYAGRTDLMLAELAPGTTVAGVLTQSQTPGQPVIWCRECLPGGRARAI